MKLIIYKNIEHLWGHIVSFIVLHGILLYVVIIAKNIESIMIFIGSLFVYCLCFFLTRELLFKTVEINVNGIIIKYRTRVKQVFLWNDIMDIKKSFRYKTRNLLFININREEILVNVNNKKIKKIIEICPIDCFKEKMKKIRFVF